MRLLLRRNEDVLPTSAEAGFRPLVKESDGNAIVIDYIICRLVSCWLCPSRPINRKQHAEVNGMCLKIDSAQTQD